MDVSVEITMSPLRDDFEPHIIEFIKTLRSSGFQILENPLSTQIYGPYDEVMPYVVAAIGKSMDQQDAVLFYMKLVKSDRSHYQPSF